MQTEFNVWNICKALVLILALVFPVALAETEHMALKSLAEQGNADAQYRMALHCLETTDSFEEAQKWLYKSAEQGHPEAQLVYGIHCLFDKSDEKQAEEWIRKSANQGCSEARMLMAASDDTNDLSVKESLEWLRLAAEQGDPDAQLFLGLREESTAWILKAAEQEHAYAQLFMGLVYQYGWIKEEKSEEKASQWLHRSAQQENPYAQVLFACWHSKSEEETKRLIYKGIDSGRYVVNALAFIMGGGFESGLDTPQNGAYIQFKCLERAYNTLNNSYQMKKEDDDSKCAKIAEILEMYISSRYGAELRKSLEREIQLNRDRKQQREKNLREMELKRQEVSELVYGSTNVVAESRKTYPVVTPAPVVSSGNSYQPPAFRVDTIHAHNIKDFRNGSGSGYQPLEHATVIAPDGSTSTYTGRDIPFGMKPVVVHPGRSDYGHRWGKHIEYQPMTRKEAAVNLVENTNAVEVLGGMALSGVKDLEEGRKVEGAMKTGIAIGAGLLILSALLSD